MENNHDNSTGTSWRAVFLDNSKTFF